MSIGQEPRVRDAAARADRSRWLGKLQDGTAVCPSCGRSSARGRVPNWWQVCGTHTNAAVREASRKCLQGMVAKGGIEPPTRGFSGRSSTNVPKAFRSVMRVPSITKPAETHQNPPSRGTQWEHKREHVPADDLGVSAHAFRHSGIAGGSRPLLTAVPMLTYSTAVVVPRQAAVGPLRTSERA